MNAAQTGVDDASDKQKLIFGAAKALSCLPTDVFIGIASSSTAKFVQTVRPIYKSLDFAFTDDDLRDIHGAVQLMARAKMALPPAGPQ